MTSFSTFQSKSNYFEILYICFFGIMPLIYSNEIVDPVLIPRQIYLTIFVFIIGVSIFLEIIIKKKNVDLSFLKRKTTLSIGLFIASIIISIPQSIAKSESLYILSKSLTIAMFFILTLYLLNTKKISIDSLTKGIIIFCTIVILISINQLISVQKNYQILSEGVHLIKSTIANKNLLSSILFLCLPFLMLSIFFNKYLKFVSLLTIIALEQLVWLTQTKAVIIALGLFFILFILLLLLACRELFKNSFIKAYIATFVITAIMATTATNHNKREFSHVYNTNTAETRLLLWKNSIEMIKENGIFGVGAGNWQIHFPKYGLNNFSNEVKTGMTTYQRPHNDFLWVFCELGILGIISFLAVFIISCIYLIKLLKSENSWKHRYLNIVFFATILGYSFISLVDFPFERIEHQTIFILIIAIITTKYQERFKGTEPKNSIVVKPIFLLATTIFICSFSAIIANARYEGESHSHKLFAAHKKANWNTIIKEVNSGISTFYTIDPTSIPLQWYKGVALFTSGQTEAAKACFEMAYSLNPFNIHIINNLASCYSKEGNYLKAEELYLKSLEISSDFEEAQLNLSATYFNMKEFEKAYNCINKVNTNSSDQKFRTYLPSILKSYIDYLVKIGEIKLKPSNFDLLLNPNTDLTSLYLESKRDSIPFVEYISNLSTN